MDLSIQACHTSPPIILEDKPQGIHSLPEELLRHIFSFLNYSEVQEVALVSKFCRYSILLAITTEENARIEHLARVMFGIKHIGPLFDVVSFSEFRTHFFSIEYKIIEQIFESELKIAEIDNALKGIRKPIFFDLMFEFVKRHSMSKKAFIAKSVGDFDAICTNDDRLFKALNSPSVFSMGNILLFDFITEYLIALSPKTAIRMMLCTSDPFFHAAVVSSLLRKGFDDLLTGEVNAVTDEKKKASILELIVNTRELAS